MMHLRTRRLRGAILGATAVLGVAFLSPPAHADDWAPAAPPVPAAPPAPLPPPPPPPAGAADPGAPGAPPPTWTADQLRELVGPIALYPDVVLASLLPATNFPLDVVSAARWLAAQGGTKPAAVPEDQPWDASVKALLQFPDVLRWMDANLPWLEQMGTAVSYQQADVLQAIQDFRRAARAAGNLATDEHLTVEERRPVDAPATAPTVVVIEPSQPEVVYVPYYDPYAVVRPYYGRPYGSLFTYGIGFNVGLSGAWAWHDLRWGWWSGSAYLGWGLYMSDSYYYWGRPRPSGWYVGPYRPQPWRAPYRTTSWSYPPRSIYRTTPYGTYGGSGPVYRSGRDSYAVRPPLDPRPTTRSYVRPYRTPTGSTVIPPAGSSFVRTPTTRTTRTIPTPSPTVRTSPWAGSTPPSTWTPRTPTRIRSTPTTTVPSTGLPSTTLPTPRSRVYTPQADTSVRPWSARGNGSLAPRSHVTVPNVQPRTLPTPQPRVIRSAPLPAPIRQPSHVPPSVTRQSSNRGRSSLYTPPPPPTSRRSR